MTLPSPIWTVALTFLWMQQTLVAAAPPTTPFGPAEEQLRVWDEPRERKLEIPILNGLYVLPHTHGGILTSRDGENFTLRMSDTRTHLETVAYGNGVYMAAGSGVMGMGELVRSTDGENWKTQPRPGAVHQVHFGNGRFLASTHSAAWVSTDGVVWTPATAPEFSGSFEKITGGPRGFVVHVPYSYRYFSPNGISWTRLPLLTENPYEYWRLHSAGEYFFALGDKNVLFTSLDGTNWASSVVEAFSNTSFAVKHIVFKDGAYYYIGRWVGGNYPVVVCKSLNGQDWTALPDPLAALGPYPKGEWKGWIRKLVPFGERLIAFGAPRRPDLNHTNTTTSLFVYEPQEGWKDLSPTNEFVAAAGAASDSVAILAGSGGKMLRSTDSRTWTELQPAGSRAWNDIIHAPGEFFAVGDSGQTARSPDGVTWVAGSTSGTEHLLSVAYGNGIYVALAGVGTPYVNYLSSVIFRSTNGIAWQKVPGIQGNLLRSVVFGNGHFLAARWVGNYLTSRDGLSWEAPGQASVANDFRVEQADYLGGWFFQYGPGGAQWTRTSPVIVTSDLYHWSQLPMPGGDIEAFAGSAWVGHPAFVYKLPFNGPPSNVSMYPLGNLSENGQTGGFQVTRQGALRLPMEVPITLSGVASPGLDYQPVVSANFTAGQATAEVLLRALPDALAETTETINISLSAADYFSVDEPEMATLKLFDQSATPRFRAATTANDARTFSAVVEVDPSAAHSLWASANLQDWNLVRYLPAGSSALEVNEPILDGKRYFRFTQEE